MNHSPLAGLDAQLDSNFLSTYGKYDTIREF